MRAVVLGREDEKLQDVEILIDEACREEVFNS